MPDTVKNGADQRGVVRVAPAIAVLAVVVLLVVFGLLFRDTMAATDLATVQAAFDRAAIVSAVTFCALFVWLISRVMHSRGRLVMFDGLTAGIEEVGQAEAELSKSQIRFQALIENTADVTILFGADETYRYVSPSITRMSGLSPEDILGRSLREFVHPIDQKMFVDALNNALGSPGESIVLPEYRVILPDGRTVFYEGLMTGLPAGAGVEGVVLNGRELTERHAAAKALEESETKYRAITENTSDITAITGQDGSYKYVSPSISRNLEYSESQIYENRFYNFIYEDDRPLLEGAFQKAVKNPGETLFYPQIRVKHADGHLVYYDIQFTGMLDVPGVEGIVASGRDVTERVLAEKDIRDANLQTQALQSRLNDAIESFDDGFMLFDSDDRLLMCNSALEKEFLSVADYLKPGTLYEDFQRAVFRASSDILTNHYSTEEALARRISHHNDPGLEPWIAETSDGRWIMVNEYRTHDGGFALIRSDVTQRVHAEQESSQAREQAEQAQALMKDAIESIADGFALYDSDDRFVLCNTAYRLEFPELSEYLVPGVSFEDFVRAIYSSDETVAADYLGEIGRAQALQALAARTEPLVDMNPVLLKPQSDTDAQVVVHGKVLGTAGAVDYQQRKATLLPAVLESFTRLSADADLVLVEGAGSPAEVNLRAGDIANMGFAEAAGVPVILAGDIDRGGVIAALTGTCLLLPETERNLIKSFLINKFKGDLNLFDEGMAIISETTGWAPLGILPHIPEVALLPAEDSIDSANYRKADLSALQVVVPMVSRIANFDDLDPLASEPGVSINMIPPGTALPGDADLVILPGSKSTLSDMIFFREQGWDIDLLAHVRRGGAVFGICAGYQMLGGSITDNAGIDGPPGRVDGLGLLDIETTLTGDKSLRQVRGVHVASGHAVTGYEMHVGSTSGPDCVRPFVRLDGRADGAVSENGQINGCYVHGIFASDVFRHNYLKGVGANLTRTTDYQATVEGALDALADQMEHCLDVDLIMRIAEEGVG